MCAFDRLCDEDYLPVLKYRTIFTSSVYLDGRDTRLKRVEDEIRSCRKMFIYLGNKILLCNVNIYKFCSKDFSCFFYQWSSSILNLLFYSLRESQALIGSLDILGLFRYCILKQVF